MSPEKPASPDSGVEWIVDARGCSPELLRSESALAKLFDRIVRELALKPIGEARFHVFPPPGGITGIMMLTESHLTIHTFPETGHCAMNLYSCRPRPLWPFQERLAEMLGASSVEAQAIARPGLAARR